MSDLGQLDIAGKKLPFTLSLLLLFLGLGRIWGSVIFIWDTFFLFSLRLVVIGLSLVVWIPPSRRPHSLFISVLLGDIFIIEV